MTGMRKYRIAGIIVCLCTALLLFLGKASYVYASEASHKIVIDDQADLLTPEEETALHEDMEPLAEIAHIGFLSVEKNEYGSVKNLAKEYYHRFFEKEDGTLLVIDMDTRYIYIFSGGENYSIVSKKRAEIITDNVYRFASKKEYYNCASEAYHEIHELLLGRRIAQPMKYLCNIILAILLALILNYIYVRSATDKQGTKAEDPILHTKLNYRNKPVLELVRRWYPARSYGNNSYDDTGAYSSSNSSSGSSHSSGSSSSSSRSSGSSSSSSRSSGSSGSFKGGGGGHRF